MKIGLVLAALTVISACAPLHPKTDNSSKRYYVVQPGDNFYSIAFLFETTTQHLQQANPGIPARQLQPGMRLNIPDNSFAALGGNTRQSTSTDLPIRSGDFIWPLKKLNVSSRFGKRRGRLHAGIDLRAPRGTPIYASADGKVVYSGYSGAYGRMVVIDHGRGIETAYAHNSRNLVAAGQRVRRGQVIGNVGRTGNATGNHVHFEFRRYGRPLNPVNHLQARL